MYPSAIIFLELFKIYDTYNYAECRYNYFCPYPITSGAMRKIILYCTVLCTPLKANSTLFQF